MHEEMESRSSLGLGVEQANGRLKLKQASDSLSKASHMESLLYLKHVICEPSVVLHLLINGGSGGEQ